MSRKSRGWAKTWGSSSGFEGTASFTDPTSGDLLLYTDRISLYNGQTHGLISGSLSGSSSTTEPAAIVARPGSATEFFVFTNGTSTTGTSSLGYSIVDLSVGVDGSVTTLNSALPEPPTQNAGEALDVVVHDNGVEFWVLTFDGADEDRRAPSHGGRAHWPRGAQLDRPLGQRGARGHRPQRRLDATGAGHGVADQHLDRRLQSEHGGGHRSQR